MPRAVAFPSKFAPRGSVPPITGNLDSIKLDDEQRQLIDRITVGIFIDMQNKPLADIFAACYISGVNHAHGAACEDKDND